jgi:hypothetical protein
MSDRLTRQGKAHSASALRKFTDRCTIRKVSKVKGPDMGNVNRETILASDVPCKLSPSSADERQIAGATEGRAAYTVRIPFWQGDTPIDVDSTCYFDIAARGEVEAQTLHVIAPLPGSGTKIDAVAERTA